MRKTFSLLLLLLAPVAHLLAYPITPRSLRKLMLESPYIIVGYVVKMEDVNVSKNDWGTKEATIAVLENLQGNIGKDTITIRSNAKMICPAPDNYEAGTYVLSFVDKNEKGIFHTHALSYGSKTLSLAAIEAYKKRIAEMHRIQKNKDEEEKRKQTVEWLIKCAEVEATRYEGVTELGYDFNFVFSKDYDEKSKIAQMLTVEQKQRLKKVLFDTKGVVVFGLVDLVYKGNECEIENYLIDHLKALNPVIFWEISEYFKRLKHWNSSSEMTQLLKDFEIIRFDTKKVEERRSLMQKFVKLVEAEPYTT